MAYSSSLEEPRSVRTVCVPKRKRLHPHLSRPGAIVCHMTQRRIPASAYNPQPTGPQRKEVLKTFKVLLLLLPLTRCIYRFSNRWRLTVFAALRPGASRGVTEERVGAFHLHEVVLAREVRAVRLAAQVVSAPRIGAQCGAGVGNLSVVVGARVIRAERLAALGNRAHATFARHVHGVLDGSVAVRATYGVAVLPLPRGDEAKAAPG